jgi:hypothetical protein
MKVPDGWRHGFETLACVDPHAVFDLRIGELINLVRSLAVEGGELALGFLAQQVNLHEAPAQFRQCLKISLALGKRNARKVYAQEIRIG